EPVQRRRDRRQRATVGRLGHGSHRVALPPGRRASGDARDERLLRHGDRADARIGARRVAHQAPEGAAQDGVALSVAAGPAAAPYLSVAGLLRVDRSPGSARIDEMAHTRIRRGPAGLTGPLASGERRRMAAALLVSLVIHALLLNLVFSG